MAAIRRASAWMADGVKVADPLPPPLLPGALLPLPEPGWPPDDGAASAEPPDDGAASAGPPDDGAAGGWPSDGGWAAGGWVLVLGGTLASCPVPGEPDPVP
jgi:hypothetical protein